MSDLAPKTKSIRQRILKHDGLVAGEGEGLPPKNQVDPPEDTETRQPQCIHVQRPAPKNQVDPPEDTETS